MMDTVQDKAAAQAEQVKGDVEKLPPLEDGRLEDIRARTKARQGEVGYDGDLAAWVAKNPPA